MPGNRIKSLCGAILLAAMPAFSGTLYVSLDGTHVPPFTNWVEAATDIQSAIDAANVGDTVLVGAGNYSNGSRVVFGQMTNRVVVDKAIKLVGSGGPGVTHIVGFNPTNSSYDRAIRSVYLANGATLSGFTVRDGATRRSGDTIKEQNGGGIFCEPNAVISNCVISGNYADENGGGIRGGFLYNSIVVSNRSASYGGGVANSTIYMSTVTNNIASSTWGGGLYASFAYDSIIVNNQASAGGGAYLSTLTRCQIKKNICSDSGGGTYQGISDSCWYEANSANNNGGAALYSDLGNCVVVGNDANNGGGIYGGSSSNCTIVGNYAFTSGGGIYSGTFKNSIIYSNFANSLEINFNGGTLTYCCTAPMPSGTGNFTNMPLFSGGSYVLASNSPCIDAGLDSGLPYDYVAQYRPLDGNNDGLAKPDVGAYEFYNGNADSDGDGLTDTQELNVYQTSPVNSDSDGDGMYDGWEVANLQNPTIVNIPTISPTNTAATDGTYPNKIRVTWNVLQAFSNYEVWRGITSATNQATLLVTDVSTNVIDDSNAVPSQIYYYWIRAKNSAGVSGLGTSDTGQVLSPPTTINASDATFVDRVRLNWADCPGATSYEVWRSFSSNTGTTVQVTSSVTTNTYDYTTSNATNVQYLWIKAKNANGTSVYGSYDTGFARLSPPTSVSATDGTILNGIKITWTAPSGASGYQVWRGTNDNSSLIVLIATGLTTNEYVDGATTGDVSYFYWVLASNALSVSSMSSSNSGYWLSSPTNVQVSDGNFEDRVRVTWTQTSGAIYYDVWRGLFDSTSAASIVASYLTTNLYDYTSANKTNLQYFWVTARDASSGSSAFSESDSGFVRLSPPTGVSATDGTLTNSVRISWTAVTGASSYGLLRGTNSNDAQSILIASSITTNSFVDTTAVGATIYFYWVKASNTLSVSSLSASNTGYWLPAPAVVQASDGTYTDRVNITWSQSLGATSYDVYRGLVDSTSTAVLVASTVTTNFYDYTSSNKTNLQYFWIKARDASSGSSDFSSSEAGFVRLSSPSGVNATDGTVDYAIRITWTAVTGASGYGIWRGTNDNDGVAILISSNVTTNVFDDTTSTAAITYFYWVTASNSLSISGLSASNSGYWLSPPMAVDASDGSYTDRIAVSWSLPVGINTVEVWRGTSASSASATRIADNYVGTTYDDFSVNPGLIRYYWLKSKSTAGSSAFSASNTGYRGLSPPASVNASDNSALDSVTITWSFVTGASSYELWRSLSSDVGTAIQISTGVTGTTFADLTAFTWRTNFYWVIATGTGASAFSNPDPGSRKEVDASDSLFGGYVRVTWSKPDGSTSYEVWRNIVDDSSSATRIADNLTTNIYDDTSAFPSQLYYYWVKPKNGPIMRFSHSDSGIRSLASPSGVQASNGSNTETVLVTWNSVGAATSYEVWRNTLNDTNSAERVATNLTITSFSDNPPIPAFVYYYWVKAVSVFSTSAFSSTDWGFRRMSSPEIVSATDGTPSDRVIVTWQPVLGAVFYEVWRNTENSTATASIYADFVSDTFFDDNGEDAYITHYYWVKAKNAVSTSDFSVPDSGYSSIDPLLDSDEDGIPDAQETYAGTDPFNSNSFLRVYIPNSVSSEASVVISWQSQTGRSYRVEVSPNLALGVFSNLATGLLATPPINTYTNDSGQGVNIYRIGVE